MRRAKSEGPGPPPAGRRLTCLVALGLLAGCATGQSTTAAPDAVRSHVYPLPVDNVLAQAQPVLEQKGFRVKRIGTVLVTNWLANDSGTFVAYRVFGERIDAGLCSLRVERVVAATSTSFNLDHPVTEDAREDRSGHGPAGVRDSVDEGAVGTAPPPAMYSASDLAPTSAMVVTQRGRDAALELEFEQLIDPPLPMPVEEAATASAAAAAEGESDAGLLLAASPAVASPASPEAQTQSAGRLAASEQRLTALAGIWEGTFRFQGNVTGTYVGEITVTVDDGSVEVADFCPESGGTLVAEASGNGAAWQGDLPCPPIRLKGCPSAVIKYNFANAKVNGSTLVMVAAGSVDTPAGCGAASGALSVTFVARKADYAFISVNRTNDRTACVWPSDWETLDSVGSMAMPEPPLEPSAYLGIIRAKGRRLSEIQTLLQHCRHRVLLNGQPVLMRLTATRAHQNGAPSPGLR